MAKREEIQLDMGMLGMPTKPATVAPVVASISAEPTAIALADIAPDPDQPRKQFDRSKIATIADQFKDPNIGQIEAITVKINPSGEPKYLLISGENRYRAAHEAGLKTLRAEIVETADFVHQVLSNETRTDLSAFDKANAYNTLIKSHGYTQVALANLLGKAESYVSDHIKLLDLPDIVVQAAKDGKALSVGVLSGLRKLVNTHTTKANKAAISQFIGNADVITKRDIAEFAKTLKTRVKVKQPQIDGKAFKVVGVEGDVMTIKRAGDKEPAQYRLVPVEAPD